MLKRNLLLATALLVFGAPAASFAQDNYDPWYRNNNTYRRERRNSRYNNNYSRDLRGAVNRIDRLSGPLKGDLESALDRSELNGQEREDRINQLAHDFHEAAAKFKDQFDDGRDLQKAENEAQRVLQLGARLDRFMSRQNLNGRAEDRWARISDDLRIVADSYGYRSSSYEYRDYDNNGDDPFYTRQTRDRSNRPRW